MHANNDNPQVVHVAVSIEGGNSNRATTHTETVHRVDFRQASGHLHEKRPGYYLILLRNEIRHRSLREKPALTVGN